MSPHILSVNGNGIITSDEKMESQCDITAVSAYTTNSPQKVNVGYDLIHTTARNMHDQY